MHPSDFFSEAGDAARYTVQEVIGKGSYGVVCSAIDNTTGERVAIKKINNVFDHVSDATRILREVKLLRLLRHPDIVDVKHIMLPPSPRDFKDIYVVFELMETDLHQVGGGGDVFFVELNKRERVCVVFFTPPHPTPSTPTPLLPPGHQSQRRPDA